MRFRVSLQERKMRNSGNYDRYWIILDSKCRNFIVLRVNVTYPQAENRARAYCQFLNEFDPPPSGAETRWEA